MAMMLCRACVSVEADTRTCHVRKQENQANRKEPMTFLVHTGFA
jgi:hypothetical protein